MSRKIQIVSGLRMPSPSEDSLVNCLVQLGLQPTSNVLSLEDTTNHKIQSHTAVIFILPILGDNDLLPFQVSKLKHFLTAQNLAGRKVIVILKGDRHNSDEFVLDNHPVYVKIRSLFRSINSFRILDTKLDQDTAARIALHVAYALEADLPPPCKELDLLAGLLGRVPAWNPETKQLNFDDEASGYNLLYGKSKLELEEILGFVKSMYPQTLIMNHAHISDHNFNIFSILSTVEKAQLSSNNLTLDNVLSTLPNCRWMSLAANQLEVFRLSKSGPMLENILVHKNNIREFNLEPSLACRLKRISLYRNQIKGFEWPTDQTDLESLNIGANPLSKLPESLAQTRSLKFLGIARTKITSLPDWMFNLPALKEVDVSHIEDRLPSNQLEKLLEMGVNLIKKPA